ncbi:MAG: nitroreductase/quinone reductase family protein [Actinomycetes bacterium]
MHATLSRSRADARPLSLARWTTLCAIAEAIGMTAAATAAKTSQTLIGEPGNGREAAVALSLVVGGGLVEGVALGSLQAAGLSRPLPALDRRRWLLVTTAVAGVGWAAASAPGVLSGSDSGPEPPLLLVLGGAVGLGALMGALLGAAQATGLRGHVPHPWRWVGANAAAWAPAMAIIFLGASSPGADWPGAAVAALGAATGLAAGTVLGLATGWFLPTLDGPPAYNRVVLRLLGSPAHGALDGALVALRVRGRVTGRTFELPVQYAETEAGVVVVPGRPETKRWWRNLVDRAPVDVLLRGRWQHGDAVVLRPGDPDYDPAIAAYRGRWSRAHLPDDSPLVRVWLGAGRPTPARRP